MNTAKICVARALTLLQVGTVIAAIGATGAAAEKGHKGSQTNARRQSQAGSASRGAGPQKGTQDVGKVKVPGRIEYPNLTGTRRSTDRVSLEPTSQEYPNVIESVGTKYTMVRRNGGGADTTTRRKSSTASVERASRHADLRGSKGEVAMERLELASSRNHKQASFWLPEVEDEVLLVGQPGNTSGRMDASTRESNNRESTLKYRRNYE